VINNTNGFYVYDSTCNPSCYPPVKTHVSADGRTVSIIPNAPLTGPGSGGYYAYNATDLNGNAQSNVGQGFTVSSTADVTGPTIVATNPLSTNATAVPTNTSIEVVFNSPVSGTSLGSITLTGGANGPYTAVLNNSIYTDDTVVKIVPQSLLLPNTTYSVNVSGVTDIAGNLAGTTSFSFTTGPNFLTTGVDDSTDLATITTGTGTTALPSSSTVPNVLLSPTIVVTYSHAIDPAALRNGLITLRDQSNGVLPNTLNFVISSDQTTVTVTTINPLSAGTTYHLASGSGSYWYDIAGNADASSINWTFTTQ
jgi:hypothetical protein